MITERIPHGPSGTVIFRPQVPVMTVPSITKEYKRGGIRFYKCGERTFFADQYDKNFGVKKGTVIKTRKLYFVKPGG
jgi:hypothetical protein